MTPLRLLAPRRLARLLAADATNVARDPMLLAAAALSLVPPIALFLGRGAMDPSALAAFGIAELSRYLVPLVLLLPAVLIGWVTGFLLLEERDEGTLLAVDVTPVGKAGFLGYRVGLAALSTFVLVLYAWPFVLADRPVTLVLMAGLLVAASTVGFAVALPAIARNKVEGLAVTKLTNLLLLAPLLAAIPSPLRFLGGVVPTFWLGELLGLSSVSPTPTWLALLLGLAITTTATAWLFQLLKRHLG